jgi:hypothetical protein
MSEEPGKSVNIGSFDKKAPAPVTVAAPSPTMKAIQDFMGGQNPLGVDGGAPREEGSLPDVQKLSGEELADELVAAVNAVDAAPEKTWEQQIEALGLTKEEAFKIIDQMLTTGRYEKPYPITTKISVTFQTRDFNAHENMQKALEADSPQFMGTVSMIMAKYNLAASLLKYGKREFKPNKNKLPEEAFDFIAGLPYMVFSLLLQKLGKFDELVFTVMDEGALANF